MEIRNREDVVVDNWIRMQRHFLRRCVMPSIVVVAVKASWKKTEVIAAIMMSRKLQLLHLRYSKVEYSHDEESGRYGPVSSVLGHLLEAIAPEN